MTEKSFYRVRLRSGKSVFIRVTSAGSGEKRTGYNMVELNISVTNYLPKEDVKLFLSCKVTDEKVFLLCQVRSGKEKVVCEID